MATLLHSESRRMYSWWWSSHISPKNSKWLQENLTDMDAKVKAMIKLIEEDADSFARRAEMYYKRRPELMKLVEEFYRAYRALAERYNHATVELRQAHRTMAEAFPDQVPYSLTDESPSSASSGTEAEPHTPEIRALLDSDYHHAAKKGLKQVHEMFESEGAMDQSNMENEIQTLKNILVQIQAEKDSLLSEYQQNLEKLSNLKGELDIAQQDAKGLNERASKAEIEIKILKEALLKLEAERDASFVKYNQSLEMISSLETKLSLAEKETEHLKERAIDVDNESQNLKHELSRLEAEKEAGLVQYQQCLETISVLESRIVFAELDARKLYGKAEKAESRIKELEKAVAKSNEEKEAAAFLYKQCLEALAKMEAELSHTQDEAKRLNSEVLASAEKLKSVEEQCFTLERSNQCLQSEAENLSKKIVAKDDELSRKNEELENFKTSMQDEQSRFDQVDASLEALQKLQHQSQDEQRALALEIRSGLQMLKDLESCKHGLEEEIKRVKDENRSLNELHLSSSVSEENLKHELCSLKEMKEKLEEDFSVQDTKSKALQQEICQVREEITSLNCSYEALLLQVESAGLDPERLVLSVKELQEENSKLRKFYEKDVEEKESLYEKLKSMDVISDKNAMLERSLSELNGALQESREMVKQLQESCQSLQGEKSVLVAEKASLLSQLLAVTENMQKLLEKNTSLESSLSAGKAEVEGLREKSKRIDEFCQLLIDEKSNVLDERSALVLQLGNVEQRLGSLEMKFTNLEEKCSRLEKEKEATLSQVDELKGYLGSEKQERAIFEKSSEARLTGLENNVNLLQEEIHLRKKEFEEEVEKAVNAQLEIFILQRFVEDLEEKNLSLLFECQKHVEASKLSNKLISELESENLEQQVEVEMLSDEIGKLRTEIYQVFRALQLDPEIWYRDELAKEPVASHHKRGPMLHILEKIEQLKNSLLRNKDENMKLAVENSMLFTILEQQSSDGAELESSKKLIEEELDFMAEECMILEKERDELVEVNKQLKLQVAEVKHQREAVLQENTMIVEENQILQEKISIKEEENKILGEENETILNEAISLENLSVVFQTFGMEKAQELIELSEDLRGLHDVNSNLKEEVALLGEQLGVKREENLLLVNSIEKLYTELHDVEDLNDQLNHQIVMGNDFLREKAEELSEVEQKLERSQCSSIELCRTVQALKKDHEESKLLRVDVEKKIHVIAEERKEKDEEIQKLLEANRNLELEVNRLHDEVEEGRIREENLTSELQERCNEFELWEAEASSFYFDLQLSAVNEVLLENKVHELTEVCERLKDASAAKGDEIEQMKVRVGFLESEIGGLKSQLSSCIPIISSLRDDLPSLKENALLWRQQCADSRLENKCEDMAGGVYGKHQALGHGQTTAIQQIMDLQKMHSRIEAVEKAVMEEKGRLQMSRAEEKHFHQDEELADNVNSEHLSRNWQLMKDIPLDQVTTSPISGRSRRTLRAKYHTLDPEAEEILQKRRFEPVADVITEQKELQVEKELGVDKLEISSSSEVEKKEVNKRKILERLSSDARKLTGLQVSLQDIKKRAEMKKINQMGKNIKLEAVKTQLQDLEETVVQLLIINDHLTKDIDGNQPSDDVNSVEEEELEDIAGVREKKVREQAKRESEKIGRLQFEVQDIQYVLLKMEDERKMKAGKNQFSRSRTGVMLRDFIRGSRRHSGRKLKKGCFCGCSRVSTQGE